MLVIDHVKEVTEPISEPLRRLGVRSLRAAINEPGSVSGSGDVVAGREDILARLHELQSSWFKRTFRKRLNELGVESDLVRHDWQDRFGSCPGDTTRGEGRGAVSVSPQVICTLEVDAGFDSSSGIFYLRSDHGIELSSLYESLAKQLIFKPAARPIHLFALERAVRLQIDDPSFGIPFWSRNARNSRWATQAVRGDPEIDEDVDAEPGEAESGHSPFEPNPARNRPDPGPIPNDSGGRPRRQRPYPGSWDSNGNDGSSRQTPQLEKDHRDALKHDHYASHCQMCLCERSPQELVPTGSYVEWEEVRRSIIDAHHPDLVSAGGARHAGNLILLCKLHHDNYGRQLSRAGVTAALRGSPKEFTINFGQDSEVKGQQIELEISGTGKVVKLFFTDHHIEYWLSQEITSA